MQVILMIYNATLQAYKCYYKGILLQFLSLIYTWRYLDYQGGLYIGREIRMSPWLVIQWVVSSRTCSLTEFKTIIASDLCQEYNMNFTKRGWSTSPFDHCSYVKTYSQFLCLHFYNLVFIYYNTPFSFHHMNMYFMPV